MGKQTIFRGTLANDGTGDNLRAGALKINANFDELYTALGDGSTLSSGTYVTTAASQVLTNKTIDASSNTLSNIPNSALDTIANAKLANSTISIGGITFNLGDTDATPAFDLADATNYPTTSLSGTITNAQLAGSISNDKLINNKITIGDDTSTNFDVNLGDSFEIVGGTGVDTAIDNNRITISTDSTIVTESSSSTLTNKTINGPDNTITNIANTSLSNSSITLGSDVVNLGDTKTSIAGLSLTGSGTIDLTGAGSKARFDFAGFGSLPAFGTYPGMFAFDTVGNRPYYSSGSGWVRILDENASVSAHTDVNLTGIADGYILQWSSAQGRFNVVANTATTPVLKFSDDTSTTARINADDVEVLGFIGGSGISTVIDDANNTVTISNTMSFSTSKLTGDGSTTAFTINSGRTVDDVLVFVNGICLVPTDDYTSSGTTMTFALAPAGSAEITVRYLG